MFNNGKGSGFLGTGRPGVVRGRGGRRDVRGLGVRGNVVSGSSGMLLVARENLVAYVIIQALTPTMPTTKGSVPASTLFH